MARLLMLGRVAGLLEGAEHRAVRHGVRLQPRLRDVREHVLRLLPLDGTEALASEMNKKR